MKLLFLGTGTSTGVPQIGCQCATCRSLDPADKRLRSSALLQVDGKNILIDCGPDFRMQMLTANAPSLDALLVTHSHYDHVGGIDDLRPYCFNRDFPVYCQEDVAKDLRERVPYCFYEHLYPGVPTFALNIIEANKPVDVAGIEVLPLRVMHYKLPILGYRIGDFAYITDCKTMPDQTIKALKGVKTLVLNALRHEEHMSHLNLKEAMALVEIIKPKETYFTHFSHQIGPEAQLRLPDGMHMAHDFMEIEI